MSLKSQLVLNVALPTLPRPLGRLIDVIGALVTSAFVGLALEVVKLLPSVVVPLPRPGAEPSPCKMKDPRPALVIAVAVEVDNDTRKYTAKRRSPMTVFEYVPRERAEVVGTDLEESGL